MKIARSQHTPDQLISHLQEARSRLLDLVADLDDGQMTGERLAIVNPLRWEIAHVAFFQEFWLLRHLRGLEAIEPLPNLDPDKLYDSARVAHDTRWDLGLPVKRDTLTYTEKILERVIENVRNKPLPGHKYILQLALLHQDIHNEAITYTRQTLGVRRPGFSRNESEAEIPAEAGTTSNLDDAFIPGGTFRLGSETNTGFVFDNEQWAHEMMVEPFFIARTAVTQAEFAEFVNDGGYSHRGLWCEGGWRWRESVKTEHPVYWKSAGAGNWFRRVFDQWLPLEPNLPVIHVNWYEAE